MAVRHDNSPIALQAAKLREAAKPGRHKQTGRGSGLTPAVKTAIETLIFGKEGDPHSPVSQADAAAVAGISPRALKAAMLKPAAMQFYQQQLAALRNGERAASIRTIVQIRDDTTLKSTAAGQNVRLKAADTLAFDRPSEITVNHNTQINNTLNVTPGYVIDLTPDDDEERLQIKQGAPSIDHDPHEHAVYSGR